MRKKNYNYEKEVTQVFCSVGTMKLRNYRIDYYFYALEKYRYGS